MTWTQDMDARTVMAPKDVIEAELRARNPGWTREQLGHATNDELMRIVARTQNPVSTTDMPGLSRAGRTSLPERVTMTLSG